MGHGSRRQSNQDIENKAWLIVEIMKLLHVVPYFPPDHWGGIEVHMLELGRYLSADHKVIVVTSCLRNQPSVAESDGLTVCRLRGLTPPSLPPVLPKMENPFVVGLDTALHSFDFDLIHAHGQEYLISWLAAKCASERSIPFILTIHHTGEAFAQYPTVRLLRTILKRTAIRFSIESSRATIAVSKGALSYLRMFRPKRAYLIPNAIDLKRFEGLRRASEYVLFVGRLDALKGPELLVRASPLILREVDAHFAIVGDGPERGRLIRLTEDLKVEGRFTFLRDVSYKDVPRIVAKCSVFVAPHNAGYSMLEAGAAGKPVVSAMLDWNFETLGEAALYFPPRDVRKLAQAVVRVLKDRALAERLGRDGRIFIEKHRTWDVLAPRIVEVYESVVSERYD